MRRERGGSTTCTRWGDEKGGRVRKYGSIQNSHLFLIRELRPVLSPFAFLDRPLRRLRWSLCQCSVVLRASGGSVLILGSVERSHDSMATLKRTPSSPLLPPHITHTHSVEGEKWTKEYLCGKGAHSHVFAIRHGHSGYCCALKAMAKSTLVEKNLLLNAITELRALRALRDSPFVLPIFQATQNEDFLFLLMSLSKLSLKEAIGPFPASSSFSSFSSLLSPSPTLSTSLSPVPFRSLP